MPIHIQAPDGSIAEFPDGTPDATITSVMAKTYGGPKSKPSTGMDILRGGASGLIRQGVGGLADMVASAIPGVNVLERVTSGGNPFTADPTHVSGNLFQRMLGAPAAYTPKTPAGRVAQRVAPFALAAAVPGSVPSRIANAVVPAVTSEVAGGLADAAGAPQSIVRGARTAGAIAGGVMASARLGRAPAANPDEQVANLFAQRAGVDPAAASAKADEMRGAGVDPTLLDVTGQKGLRLARAVGVTSDNAGEALQGNAASVSSTTKPAAMARTRALAGDTRSADQLASDLGKARSVEAQTSYAEPYAAPIKLDNPDVIQALRDPEGASAINRAITAARARMDYAAMTDLQALKNTANGPTGDAQVWPTTGRALDRVQIAFGDKGRALSQNGANDIASGMFKRQELLNGALDNVSGLSEARAAYRAKSQAIDLLTKPSVRKDPFSTDPADYAKWADSLSPEAQHANRIAIRQDILNTLGGQRAGTSGSIDELATSQYARANLAKALGQSEAGSYLANLSARLAQKANASFASPNGGSRTAVLENDAGKALGNFANAADYAHKAISGNALGIVAKLAAHLKTMGISDADAQALAQASTDPNRLDGVLQALRRAKGPGATQSFITFRGGLLGAARGQSPATQQPARR